MEAWKCHLDIKLLIALFFLMVWDGVDLHFHGIAQNLPARSWQCDNDGMNMNTQNVCAFDF